MTWFLSFPGCSHPGLVGVFSLSRVVLHRSGLLLLSSSSGLVAVLPVLSGCALRRSLAVRRAVISLHPVSSRSAGHFGSDRLVSPLPHYCWSRVHGHASAGLLVESQRWGCCSWFYRASWLVGGPPTSPVALLLAFRNGAPSGPLLRVFALSLRDGVTLPGRVCLSPRSDRRLLLHLPGVCFESSRWGHPVGSWFVPDLDRNEDLFGAPSLVVGVWPSRWGHPFWVEWLFSAPSIGTKASSIHLSLVDSRWGHPAG